MSQFANGALQMRVRKHQNETSDHHAEVEVSSSLRPDAPISRSRRLMSNSCATNAIASSRNWRKTNDRQ